MPDIPIQINQNGVNALQGITPCSQVIVMLDLCCGVTPVQSEFLRNKPFCKCVPIHIGVGHVVRIKAPSGTAKLGSKRHQLELGDGVVQTFHEDGQLLAQCHWTGWLSVGSRQHGDTLPPFR